MTRARETSELANFGLSNEGQAKAWVNFNGSYNGNTFTEANGGIRSAHNVSSVTSTSVGQYTLNFETAFSNTDYCFVAFRRDGGDDSTVVNNCAAKLSDTKSTTQLKVRSIYQTTHSDSPEVNIIVFA